MSKDKERTLVLGGGGITGIAWESGVLAGLIESGVGLELADRIIGTSAGSFVGAVLANGYDMRTYYYELNERIDDSDHAKLSSDIYRLWQNAFIVGRDDAKLLSEHSHVLVISPDSKSRAEIGDNIYNPNNILKIGNAGYEQGKLLAQRIHLEFCEWVE
ncbi:hypothetical protein CVS44_08960 [Staphylococcus haemolyticus]|nr:hypothetical protein CVS44_08960 [Staphylococcus haemolyticus]